MNSMGLESDEAQELHDEQEAIRIAVELKKMTMTRGWGYVRQMLSTRPLTLALLGIKSEKSLEFVRGQVDEAEWLLKEIDQRLEAAEEIRQSAEQNKRVSQEAVRSFLGRRGGTL